MKENQSLYSLIYTDLKTQILSERWKYGEKLPSVDQLSLHYYIGKWTVRKALELLEKDGLIRTQERKRAVVLYQSPYKHKQDPVPHTLQRRSEILSVYQTMELLMPDILALCSRSAKVYELKHFEPIVKWEKHPQREGCWKLVSDLLHDLLLASGNLLFLSMYRTLEFHAEVSFVVDHQYPLTAYDMVSANLTPAQILQKLQTDHYTVRRNFSEYYHNVRLSVENLFDRLETIFPGAADSGKNAFAWDIVLDRLYRKVGRDLIQKVITGIYPIGSRLPSESKLAGEYGVSVFTIRRALRLLSLIGFVKTEHGKGSSILLVDYRNVPKLIHHEEYRHDFLLYLSGLQLMAIAIRAAAPLAFPLISKEDREVLRNSFSHKEFTPLKVLTDCVAERTPLYPLKVILMKAGEIVNWWYLYAIYAGSNQNVRYARTYCEKALSCLEYGNPNGFASCLFDCYCYLFQTCRDFYTAQKIIGADHLQVPD